jgi:hypothetical protein
MSNCSFQSQIYNHSSALLSGHGIAGIALVFSDAAVVKLNSLGAALHAVACLSTYLFLAPAGNFGGMQEPQYSYRQL